MISRLEKTKNKINSNKKKAKVYSFAWFVKDLFQHSIMHTGINKAVNCIKIKARPSIPTIKLMLIDWNHGLNSKS